MDWVLIAFALWTAGSLVLGAVIGRAIRLADERAVTPLYEWDRP